MDRLIYPQKTWIDGSIHSVNHSVPEIPDATRRSHGNSSARPREHKPTVFKKSHTWCGSNATNSNQSKGFAPFVFSWLTTSCNISTTSEFEFTAICRVRFTFRTHETIWLRRQTCSEYVKYPTNGVQRRGWREQADNKKTFSYVNSRLNYISPENPHCSKCLTSSAR